MRVPITAVHKFDCLYADTSNVQSSDTVSTLHMVSPLLQPSPATIAAIVVATSANLRRFSAIHLFGLSMGRDRFGEIVLVFSIMFSLAILRHGPLD